MAGRAAVFVLGASLLCLLSSDPARGDEPDPGTHPGAAVARLPAVAAASSEYADADAEDCMDCHDQDAKYPVLPILATPHGVKADSRTPLASEHECQRCHGGSAAHMDDETKPVEIAFGPDAPVGPQNDTCLGCHQDGRRMTWAGSRHDLQNVACASCHKVHALEDQVLVKNIDPMRFAREGQAAVCFQCHKEKRAQMQHRRSSHPLREGKIDCSDCHNPHGSIGPVNLARPTLNETCYQCHAEKRGPFLWEHAPVREDCSICHEPHGSNNPTLLRTRMPQLCQQCHMAAQHPSGAYGGPVPGPPIRIDRRVGALSCLNCHTEVHGSNHPSGARWTR
jgi:DmsE family decaheme c-type cytochrome